MRLILHHKPLPLLLVEEFPNGLFVGKEPHLVAVNSDHADGLVFLQHRHSKQRSDTGEVSRLHHNRIALGVSSLRAQISDLNRSTVLTDTRNWSAWAGTKDWLLRDLISPGGRRSVQRGSPQAFAVE